MKQVRLEQCPHEDCQEVHLLKPGTFRVVRGETGQGAKSYGIKRTAEDRRTAALVKARDKGLCRRCGKQGIEAAHIFSRRHKATRHLLVNLLLLCRPCHRWGHDNPDAFQEWAKEELGAEAYEELRALAYRTQKRVPRRV